MANLIPTSDLVRDRNYDMGNDSYDFIGKKAYGNSGEQVGTIREALTEEGGKIRYFVVEVGSWFTSKEVVVPVGLARVEDDGVYFDSLTKDQVKEMNEYQVGQEYGDEAQVSDIRTLRGTDYVAPVAATGTATAADHYQDEKLFGTPTRLQLLEERLMVNKEKYQAGSVQVGKKVETRTENVNVALSHDEVVIERRPVTEARPVEGNVVLGAATDTIRVDLEAERANVSKQAYVTEEVEVGKRTETEQKTYSDTLGREVLDVTKTGEVQLTGDVQTDASRIDSTKIDTDKR
ncbi:PRC and DUF2382 domain-containing protein [Deinococcus altitudinis]|uniref:PRC and DUF2382 domain-containing protein n=1 Tax=Deinococcus altitudinis TaxID=468914 RepID=UPI0038911E92